LAVGPKLAPPDAPDPKDRVWKGPAWYRYTPTLATSADGLVYITGGSARPAKEPNARPEISAAVEVWDARTNEWRELAPMRHARKLHAAAVDRRGRLFVFGGSAANVSTTRTDDETRASFERRAKENHDKAATSLASVEMYDPETNRWSERAPMPIPRQAMGADLGADGRIYVVGGAPSYTHPRPMAVVEIYDPERDRWETGPSLRYRRRSHAVVATPDGQIYAIGGFVGPRERTLRQRLAGDFIEADLGATVEVLDTRPKP
jgi:N-acetylneuraminic acid mutarotase